jgi:predicted DNA-binding transcriptional regulator
MPFNTLFLNCLIHGTSFSEKGPHVRVKPGPGETVLFFHVDEQRNRECGLRQALEMQGGKICDLVVFYSHRDNDKKVLCLVELKKGSDVDRAAKQVTNIYQNFRRSLTRSLQQRIDWRAYIYMEGSAPKNIKKVRRDLEKTFGRDKIKITGESDLGRFLRS